ncbi:hypothetical protein CHS0354_019657 [Potamilus streckersoni]|uniref:Uncharacterized protein n=1 Tax=Potamilus streckersoni TaxID=2493646 RepID=A0AAE0TA39_9BIVA|nr:hypothetical protein CHS0354_019657 [Potamilus streckersoni]
MRRKWGRTNNDIRFGQQAEWMSTTHPYSELDPIFTSGEVETLYEIFKRFNTLYEIFKRFNTLDEIFKRFNTLDEIFKRFNTLDEIFKRFNTLYELFNASTRLEA